MTIDFTSLIFIWLLPLTASSTVTSGQNHTFTNVMTEEIPNDQLTTQEPVIGDAKEETTKASTTPLQQTTPTVFLPNIQTAATYSTSSQLNSSTVGTKSTTEAQLKVTTPPTMVVTSLASNPTATIPSMLTSSAQSRNTGKTSQFTSDEITHPSTSPTRSTNFSTPTTSTKPVENKSTSTNPVTMQSTGLFKTLPATTKTPFIHITKAKKRQVPPVKKSQNGANHSKAVAGIICGALVLMMVGFLVIYIKKWKLQKQQITTKDWAGPSPFLEGGADNGQVTLRSSNWISLSSFLPQRLSKRLSLLPEADEELEDMTPGTFGDKHQGASFAQEVAGNDEQESNGSAVVVPEMKSTGDAPEMVENSVSGSSSQTNEPLSTYNNSNVTNLSEDHSANPPTPSGAVDNALV